MRRLLFAFAVILFVGTALSVVRPPARPLSVQASTAPPPQAFPLDPASIPESAPEPVPVPVEPEAVVVAQSASQPEPSPPPPPQLWPSSLSPCGGDLPPCYVKQRESGGNYSAQNPSSSASGAWQVLDSTWGGWGGYIHAKDAPPDVQDDFARHLWAGGAGCSHWDAC